MKKRSKSNGRERFNEYSENKGECSSFTTILKKERNSKYDKIFVDLNDDQICIDLAAKNMKGLKRILKPGGVITAQVGCLSKKPRQVNNWMKVLSHNFGNAKLDEVVIPSFDCRWNFASSIMNS